VERYEQLGARDYRLNFRLAQACKADAPALCGGACGGAAPGEVCGGKVLACLADRRDEIEAEECRREVYFHTKMQVQVGLYSQAVWGLGLARMVGSHSQRSAAAAAPSKQPL
jgi:hypothetical protein